MPIVRIADRLVHFAHVPKCAGTSVEHYLAARFGPLAFRDATFGGQGSRPESWMRCPPQHIPAAWLDRLFPPGFLAASFALVRDPAERLLSAYLFQRDVERAIPRARPFEAWLAELPGLLARRPFVFDGHFLPMTALVPKGATVFRLEDGADRVIPWLDAQAGGSDGPRKLPVRNRLEDRRGALRTRPEPVRLTAADLAVISALYAADYERFGYEPRIPDPR